MSWLAAIIIGLLLGYALPVALLLRQSIRLLRRAAREFRTNIIRAGTPAAPQR